MKKILAILLVLAISLSLCGCSRNIASPGGEKDQSGDDSKEPSGTVTGYDEQGATDQADKADANTDSSDISAASDDGSGENTVVPESTKDYDYTSGNASINISYGDGMNVTETDDGMASIEYEGCRLFVQDVTDDFNPNTTDAETYLYDFAYEKCVQLVMETYGTITQFNGEYALSVSDNEIYGYGAHMTCDSQTQVYAFIKMVTLDAGKGYAVVIGICDDYNYNVFDNVEVK